MRWKRSFKRMRTLTTIMLLCVGLLSASAQERKVENKPYIDFRPFHLGIVVGTHLQDMELVNRGPQLITDETGATSEKLISVDQDRWDAGFNVGVVGELRINTNFQLRLTPQLYFGTRHLTFLNHTDVDAAGRNIVQHQEMKTAYISTAFDVILAPLRFNNHRPYLIAGINPMLNLSGKETDYIRLKRFDAFAEVGVGCDFYLPYFKLRPELKFMFGLTNALDPNHASKLPDKNMFMYANAASDVHSKMIVLSFYFE